MPVYEYECAACNHRFEEWQKITDQPIKTCPACRKDAVERLISMTSFHLKGGGWYSDLYGSSKKPAAGGTEGGKGGGGEGGGGGGGDKADKADKADKGGSKPAEASKSSGGDKPAPKKDSGGSGGGSKAASAGRA